jgi:hypothetical protein
MRRLGSAVSTGALAILLAGGAAPWDEDPARLATQIDERRAANRALLAQYTWKQRIEVTDRGKVVSQAVELVRPTADGGFATTPIAETSGKQAAGPLGDAAGRKRGRKQRAWHAELTALLAEYALPTVDELRDYLMRATIGPGDMTDTIRIRGRDVVKAGDELATWVDAGTRELLRTRIMTRVDDDAVTAEIDYVRTADGLVFKTRETVRVPSFRVALTIERFALEKQP